MFLRLYEVWGRGRKEGSEKERRIDAPRSGKLKGLERGADYSWYI